MSETPHVDAHHDRDHESRHVQAGADDIDSALDARAIALANQGEIAYRAAAANTLAALPPAAAGLALLTQGAGANPIWGAPAPAAHESTHIRAGADDIDSALDARAIALANQGDIVYHAAGANTLAALAPAAAGLALVTGGAGANPSWAAPAPAPHESTHVRAGSDDIDSALDARAVALVNHGEIVFRAAAANTLAALAVGVAGQALLSGGPAADISWGAPAPAAHKDTHKTGGGDAFLVADLLDGVARVHISKNSGAVVGTRRELNLIEGANITLTIADDGANEEVDVTVAATNVPSAVEEFYPAPNPDGTQHAYATMQMLDGVSTVVSQTFAIPATLTLPLVTAVVVVIPAGTGNLRRSVATNFGALCNNEQSDTHTDSIAVGQVAVTDDEIECIDISAALTGIAAGDMVGIQFTRDAADALDTVNAVVHYCGVYIVGTAPYIPP